MTESDHVPAGGAHDLDLAAEQLRRRPSALPVEVVDRVLGRVLATPRPAELVRAGGQDSSAGALRVSTVALVALLREALDTGLDGAVPRHVRCSTTRDEALEGVTLQLVVRYGEDIRVLAAHAHDIVERVLGEALGPLERTPDGGTRMHVHVSAVTAGDPRLVDPHDEA